MTVPVPVLLDRLDRAYPNATYELNWKTPLELLVGTILAAQCTDERVNALTPALFARYRNARDYAQADIGELEDLVRASGFYKAKAKKIQECCRELVANFGGNVPRTMDEMLTLTGVARKTANVVLTIAYGLPTGIIVDSHAYRVSGRMGLTAARNPENAEVDLMRKVPEGSWITFGPALVLHGRYTCTNTEPDCNHCVFNDVCPRIGVTDVATSKKPGKPAAPDLFADSSDSPAPVSQTPAPPAATPAALTPVSTDIGDASKLPPSWQAVLGDEFQAPYWNSLQTYIADRRRANAVFPPENEVFTAFHLCPYENVRVLLLGQDPYPTPGQAHGLCFSVKPKVTIPASLRNMYKEMTDDLGIPAPKHGFLSQWAAQGMLMINAVMTVDSGAANSHKDRGWETFTDAVIRAVSAKPEPVIFVLWGGYAQKKARLIDESRHTIIKSAHPSPLSASNGFFGSKPYTKIDEALVAKGYPSMNWQLDPV